MDIYKNKGSKTLNVWDGVQRKSNKVCKSGQDKICNRTDSVKCIAITKESAEIQVKVGNHIPSESGKK